MFVQFRLFKVPVLTPWPPIEYQSHREYRDRSYHRRSGNYGASCDPFSSQSCHDNSRFSSRPRLSKSSHHSSYKSQPYLLPHHEKRQPPPERQQTLTSIPREESHLPQMRSSSWSDDHSLTQTDGQATSADSDASSHTPPCNLNIIYSLNNYTDAKEESTKVLQSSYSKVITAAEVLQY